MSNPGTSTNSNQQRKQKTTVRSSAVPAVPNHAMEVKPTKPYHDKCTQKFQCVPEETPGRNPGCNLHPHHHPPHSPTPMPTMPFLDLEEGKGIVLLKI